MLRNGMAAATGRRVFASGETKEDVPIPEFEELKRAITSEVPAAKMLELLSAAQRCTEKLARQHDVAIDALGRELVVMIPDAHTAEALAHISAARRGEWRTAPLPMPDLVPAKEVPSKIKIHSVYMEALKGARGSDRFSRQERGERGRRQRVCQCVNAARVSHIRSSSHHTPFPDKQLPEGCDLEVVAAALQLANVVAIGGVIVQVEGAPPQVASKGILCVLGDEKQLLDDKKLGQCGDPNLNRFLKMHITVFDFLADPDVREELLPCFAMDKAMIFCFRTGRILGNKFGIASIEEGDKSAGTKLQAASAIAQHNCVAIKVSEDICEPGGDQGGVMQVFPGTKGFFTVPKVCACGRGVGRGRGVAASDALAVALHSPSPIPAPTATPADQDRLYKR